MFRKIFKGPSETRMSLGIFKGPQKLEFPEESRRALRNQNVQGIYKGPQKLKCPEESIGTFKN
jgi:hypothetical protein